MANLDERQVKILKSIIDEYIGTALPVGSGPLEKKYNLGISPATIRNEMARLTQDGYLKKVHSSSGRVPTPMALNYYVHNLMKEQQMSLSEEVAVKEKVWDHRHELDKLLREMTRDLAQRTKELAIATTDQGDIYVAGMANILDAPEFFDIDLTKALLAHLDEMDYWLNMINRPLVEGTTIELLMGRDLGGEMFESCGFIFRHFEAGPRKGVIGVVGPARVNYNRVFPTVNYFGKLINEFFRGW